MARTGRRGARLVLAAGAVALSLLLVGAVAQTPAVAAASFTADDVTVTSNSGELDALTVAPTGTVTYSGLESASTTATVEVRIDVDGTWETVATRTKSVSGATGSFDYDVPQVDVLAATSDGLTASEFRTTNPNSPTSTTVAIQVQVTLAGADDGGTDLVRTASDTFTVTVEKTGGPPGGGGGPPGGGGGPP